jgi:DNA-binding MarR family transcriptional regulator
MADDERIREVQRLYPLLYFACHDSHARDDGLGESDLRLLHHIDGRPDIFASALARHLGLSRSRVSEALKQLEAAGLIQRAPEGGGRKWIRLTEAGEDAIRSRDGLAPESIGAVLDALDAEQQERVVDGLRLLAHAIRNRRP